MLDFALLVFGTEVTEEVAAMELADVMVDPIDIEPLTPKQSENWINISVTLMPAAN